MKAALPHLPILQVLVPLFAAFLCGFVRREKTGFALALVVSWVLPFISGALLWQVLSQGVVSYHIGGWEPPWGIEYRVDLLNAFVLMLVSVMGAVTMPFAYRSVAFEIEEDKRGWFYCMYLLCLAGLLGIAVTGDAFNAFVFLEISSLATYVLIALGRSPKALLAAFQYLIMGTIGATFYVIGIGFLYVLTGSLNIADVAERLTTVSGYESRAIIAALAFITVGLSLKLALFPLHVWLPGAYANAPSFATVFLSATATKVAVYLLVRYFYSVFGRSIDFDTVPVLDVLVVFAIAAMFVASIVAVFESELKRMLAYSSLSQVGYIMLGLALANKAGLTAGLVHLFNHAVMKATVFLALGAVFLRVRSCRLEDLAGLGHKMPLTMAAFAIGGFGLIGVPGTAGFVSKWYLVLGALEKGWWWLAFLIVASSLIAVLYVGKVLEVVWFRPAAPGLAHAKDPPLSMLLPLLVLAAATVYFGFDTEWTVGVASKAAAALLGGIR